MSKYRRAAKVDQNQSSIVRSLRQLPGITVSVGHDDIILGREVNGVKMNFWFEIKRPECIGKDGVVRPSALTDSEKKLMKEWRGHYAVVSSLDEILDEIKG